MTKIEIAYRQGYIGNVSGFFYSVWNNGALLTPIPTTLNEALRALRTVGVGMVKAREYCANSRPKGSFTIEIETK